MHTSGQKGSTTGESVWRPDKLTVGGKTEKKGGNWKKRGEVLEKPAAVGE